eukprot:4628974-Amphidinium_carterae.1
MERCEFIAGLVVLPLVILLRALFLGGQIALPMQSCTECVPSVRFLGVQQSQQGFQMASNPIAMACMKGPDRSLYVANALPTVVVCQNTPASFASHQISSQPEKEPKQRK